MSIKGFTRNFQPMELLSEEELQMIHCATLGVLESRGVKFEHPEALKLFEKNGCRVNHETMQVRMPPGLVEECMRRTPSSFRMKARDPKNDLQIGGNTLYFTTFPGLQTVDLNTWEPRKPTRQEYYDAVTVLDALENLHCLWAYAPWWGFDEASEVMGMLESTAAKARFSSKAQKEGCLNSSEVFTAKIAKVIGTTIGLSISASPPLTYHYDKFEIVRLAEQVDSFMQVGSGGIRGSSAPATLAGATVSNNVEIIAGIVLTQLVKPGMPVIVGDFVLPQDMRSGNPLFGDISIGLHAVVFNQYFKQFDIPTHFSGAGPTNSKSVDFQCGYEKTLKTLVAALSGFNTIALFGGLYGELAAHPVQAILDDDIAGMIGHFLEGIEVNNETLATDLIEEVGPIPGFYLDKAHTRNWWRKEQFLPKAADRLTYPEWLEQGKKIALDYAKQRMEEILATHKPTPLTPEQDAEIENILEQARQYYKNKGFI